MEGILRNMLRVGRVSSIDPAKGTARVEFEAQGLVSYDLQIVSRQTLANKDYHMPDIGEKVLCAFLPTGNAEGFILGSVYSENDTPPVTDPNKRTVVFEDGTKIEYDRATHTLDVDTQGDVNLTTKGKVMITSEQDIEITTTAKAKVTAQTAEISSSSTVSITGTAGVTINGSSRSESW